MAPLDTGSVNILRLSESFGRGPGPSPGASPTIGAHLRAVREHRGFSIAQVADATRVRRQYLQALEVNDLAPLPSRPFAVGYVRSYARMLGLDGDAAVARFKAENPEASQPLRAPVGVQAERDQRRRVLYAGGAVLVVGLALWNIAQRTLITGAPSAAVVPASALAWSEPPTKGAIALGVPTAPPADQTTPKPYVTPGLGVPGIDKNAPTDAVAATPGTEPAVVPPQVFATRATVYGVPAKAGGVLVQASKSASLIVRAPAGQIVFARELEPGEAYRAPLGRGLTADVSDPSAFVLYVGGKLAGPLSDPQTPLDKAVAAATQPATAAH